jgi:hypothetical protein
MTFTITPIPSPAPTDLADGPAAFNANATAVTTNLTGIKSELDDLGQVKVGTPWDLKVGQGNNTTQRLLVVQRLVGADLWEMRMQVDSATDPFVFQSLKNGVPVTRLSLQASGQLNVNGGTPAAWRPVPFATYAGSVLVPVAGTTNGTANHNFPTDRFTHPPIVVVTSTNSLWVAYMTGASTTGCAVGARNWQNQAGGAGGTVNVQIFAVQMLPSGSSG